MKGVLVLFRWDAHSFGLTGWGTVLFVFIYAAITDRRSPRRITVHLPRRKKDRNP